MQPGLHAGPVGVIEALAQDFLVPEMAVGEPGDLRPRIEVDGVGHLGEILELDLLAAVSGVGEAKLRSPGLVFSHCW